MKEIAELKIRLKETLKTSELMRVDSWDVPTDDISEILIQLERIEELEQERDAALERVRVLEGGL